MYNQVYVFMIFILNGILIGITFDVFRILRKSFKTPDKITYIEDIIFGIISSILVLYSIMKFNNGEPRLYLFLGICLGLILYLLIFSKSFIKIFVFIVLYIKKLIYLLIIVPSKFAHKYIIKRFIFKPVTFIIINIKKCLKTFKNKKL